MTTFTLDQRVRWFDSPGKIVGIMSEPSAIVELDNGQTVTIAQRMLEPITDELNVTNGERLAELPYGRYYDNAYEWDHDEDGWRPLNAPSGMPSLPQYDRLSAVITKRVPLSEVLPT